MAFFKFQKSVDDQSGATNLPDTLEAMRRRAKYRLIGAAVLVVIGVVGFPMLFDKQPRPISVDMPIEIPDRNKVKPVAIPVTAPAPLAIPKPEIAASATPTPSVATAMIEEKAPVVPLAAVAEVAKKGAASEAMPAKKLVENPVEKPLVSTKPAVKVDETSKVQALLDGHAIDKKNEAIVGRFVVQVGAFADVTKARDARLKLEHAGLKTYTQVAETKDGRRIRVRVGPFGNKAEAEKAADKIKRLSLPATILTL
jgi:DedD protein